MPKVLWAALPIALFFVVAGALALARRPLSRVALNVAGVWRRPIPRFISASQ